MSDNYPEKDFPWSFYFNGEVMPKWGACWGMAGVARYLEPKRDADQDVGHRDIYITYCQIDHVGVVESADADIFIYSVQEVLDILLSHRDAILAALREQPLEVYSGLVMAALRMRELAVEQRCAYWTSGYEADRALLVETMRCCQLPPDSPDFTIPPHVRQLRYELQWRCKAQVRRLHQLSQSGQFDKDLRRRLHGIRVA